MRDYNWVSDREQDKEHKIPPELNLWKAVLLRPLVHIEDYLNEDHPTETAYYRAKECTKFLYSKKFVFLAKFIYEEDVALGVIRHSRDEYPRELPRKIFRHEYLRQKEINEELCSSKETLEVGWPCKHGNT